MSDKLIIELIKTYLNSHHTITTDKMINKKGILHHRLSIGGPKCNQNLINHFEQYPL